MRTWDKENGYAQSLNTVLQLKVIRTVVKEIVFDKINFLSVTKTHLEEEFRVLWLGVELETFWLLVIQGDCSTTEVQKAFFFTRSADFKGSQTVFKRNWPKRWERESNFEFSKIPEIPNAISKGTD